MIRGRHSALDTEFATELVVEFVAEFSALIAENRARAAESPDQLLERPVNMVSFLRWNRDRFRPFSRVLGHHEDKLITAFRLLKRPD